MKITRIVSSLTFLLSLSMAAVASEKDFLTSFKAFPSNSISYISKDYQVVTFKPEAYIQNLKDALEPKKQEYYKRYEDSIPSLENIQFIHKSFPLATGLMAVFAISYGWPSYYLSAPVFAGIVVALLTKLIMGAPPKEIGHDDYIRAKRNLKHSIEEDLYNKGLLKQDKSFLSIDGEQFFNQFFNKLTNPSTPR